MNGSQNIFATNQQINSENIKENASCNICARTFRTNRGLPQNLNFCRRRNITSNGNQTITISNDNNDNTSNSNNSNDNDIPDKIEGQEKFYWNLVAGSTFEKDLNNAYENIVHWKKSLFMLPSGVTGKRYVEEVTRLMKLWIQDTPLKSISLKAVHVMPVLLLQKLSKSSKVKDHLQELERRIKLWDEGNVERPLYEYMTIQQRLTSDKEGMAIAKISLKFKNLMSKRNVNGALKLLTDNMQSGI